jgi:hypothetical protein
MLDNPFISNVLSELIAGVILLALPPALAVLVIYFGTLRRWARQNTIPLGIGFLIGSVLAASAVLLLFQNPSPPQTRQAAETPPQSITPPIPEPVTPPPPASKPEPQPQQVSETPSEIIRWYQRFQHPVYGQEMARKLYYNNYVEWELYIRQISDSGSAYAIQLSPTQDNSDRMFITCYFGKQERDVFRMNHDQKVIIRGMIQRMSESNILLTNCQVLKFL